ncbi:SDR family NAD(P)-dependent oxidoreductase [Frankia sp. AiPs1]|uniref:SDR family NAD(P)-dependent oxidoreductase n=1 Tax=Frankia sp. AiPa1 TaxID=573492 RepID=UPI00202AFD83|nr:SDR family NAD(P)-dependent oxidoreductase [Frankia sp. AiPa1]MCL9760413.1 SDR family NAD(P)-dependent oxidoreductase [Frankia sp. AiPa1]
MPDGNRPVAIVTGASSGIGRGLAIRLADRGHDLALVARRTARLTVLAEELRARAGVEVTVLPADLAEPGAPRAVADALRDAGLRAEVLVNCAGFGTAGPFVHEVPERVAAEIAVNVTAPTLLTRLLLPDLLAAPRGVLLMVSSNASHQPVPNLAVYAASKAYLTSLTAAIWQETRGSGLRVLALCPGPTETEFFEAAGSRQFQVGRVASVEEVLDATVRALDGRGWGGPVLTVGGANRIRALGARSAPRRLTLAIGQRATRRAARRAARRDASQSAAPAARTGAGA